MLLIVAMSVVAVVMGMGMMLVRGSRNGEGSLGLLLPVRNELLQQWIEQLVGEEAVPVPDAQHASQQ